ncbi:MAG: hypothetical protein IPL43_02380 [Micropruina sp.]|nr:hypothetical protein [Micropruina sp.]
MTGRGLYRIPEAICHRGQNTPGGVSLSQSSAKILLPPSTPAHLRFQRDNGNARKAAWEHGSAAHQLVLGVGRELRHLPWTCPHCGDRMSTTTLP